MIEAVEFPQTETQKLVVGITAWGGHKPKLDVRIWWFAQEIGEWRCSKRGIRLPLENVKSVCEKMLELAERAEKQWEEDQKRKSASDAARAASAGNKSKKKKKK